MSMGSMEPKVGIFAPIRTVQCFIDARIFLFNDLFHNLYLPDLPNGACAITNRMCEIQENIVKIVQEVASLAECRLICQDEPQCGYITYFARDS